MRRRGITSFLLTNRMMVEQMQTLQSYVTASETSDLLCQWRDSCLILTPKDIQQIFLPNLSNTPFPLAGFLLGATGKSTQFRRHPRLPSLYKVPHHQPCSIHPSTAVTAGIFLLTWFTTNRKQLIRQDHA